MKKLVAALCALLVALPSFAGLFGGFSGPLVVIDPANIAQTTISAVKAVRAELMRIEQAKREIEMLAKSKIASSFNAEFLIEGLKSLDGVASELRKQLEKQGDINKTLASLYGASNASTPEEFTAILAKRVAAGDAMVQTLMDGSRDISIAMKQAHADHTRILGAMPEVRGVTEAAQLTGQTVGIVVQQMNSLLGVQQIAMQNQAAKDAKDNKEREAADAARAKYLRDSQELLNKAQSDGRYMTKPSSK